MSFIKYKHQTHTITGRIIFLLAFSCHELEDAINFEVLTSNYFSRKMFILHLQITFQISVENQANELIVFH
jgi:hypothetical protein